MISWPFDSLVSDDGEGNLTYDRAFNSANLRKIFHMLYTNGVALTEDSAALQVVPGSGMSVSVNAGMAIIEGAMGFQEEAAVISLEAANATYARIDTIVARLNTNLSGRSISLVVLTGTAAAAPAAPAITRAGNIYDLRLADINIPAGATAITASMITDTRLDAGCGVATARPEVLDTTAIFSQYQASLDEYMSYVRDCMGETVAGNLQNQINDIRENLQAEILDSAYPVGSIYISASSTDPSELFGGTWVRLEDMFLLAASSRHAAGSMGGEETHLLTAAEMPKHTHTGPSHAHTISAHTHQIPAHTHTASASNAGAHTHTMPRWQAAKESSGGNRYLAQGSKDSTYVTSSNGAHTHTITVASKAAFNTVSAGGGNTGASGTGTTGSAGSGSAHNNMPPYLSVYMWQRTA